MPSNAARQARRPSAAARQTRGPKNVKFLTLLFHPPSDQPSANLLQVNPYNQPHLQLVDQQLHHCANYIPL